MHLLPPRRVDRPHYKVKFSNKMHQYDLLYMPSNTLYDNKYKYILSGIDVPSKYKVPRPLRTKQAKDVSEMNADIYKVGPLTYSKIFQCDNGSEFKRVVIRLLKKHEVKISRVMTKYKHTHMAFVEALNTILAEQLFMVQDAKELNYSEQVSSTWVTHLYGLVDRFNETKTQMFGMPLKNAIGLKEVSPVENYPPEDMLPEGGLYHYLLQPGEEHCKRATNRIWSKKTNRLREVMEVSGNQVMYYLSDGPERAFVSEELILIPYNTELPLNYVQRW